MIAGKADAERLFEAIRNGDDAAAEAMIGADEALLRARDESGLSPVLVAAYSNRPKLAARMAALAGRSPEGLDVFDAAAVGNADVVLNLLSNDRASVDDRGPNGYTALHLAAGFGQLAVARLLLGRGADPNAVALNETRETPLHAAVVGGHRDTAGLLMALGASPNSLRGGGWTPLHIAAHAGEEDLAVMLLLRGADPTRADDGGQTAIDLADEGGHAALANVLRTAAPRR